MAVRLAHELVSNECDVDLFWHYLIPTNSISNINVALAGIFGGRPLAPYPSAGGIFRRRLPSTFIVDKPSIQPLITPFADITNSRGPLVSEVSQTVPSS